MTRLFSRNSLRWKKVLEPSERQAIAFDQCAFFGKIAQLHRNRLAADLDCRGKKHRRTASTAGSCIMLLSSIAVC